jgi:hypothetical protein
MNAIAHAVVAHGGAAGLVIEGLLAATVIGVFLAVWLRERRAGRSRSEEQEP